MNKSQTIPPNARFTFHVTDQDVDDRLDLFISKQFSHYSRSYFQRLIADKRVTINGKVAEKTGARLRVGDEVTVHFPEKPSVDLNLVKTDLGVQIVGTQDHFFIIYKPAGLMVHPLSEYNHIPTLVDWLKYKYHEITSVGYVDRPGIVHRLDKDTSGLMIIPRTNYAYMQFGDMFRNREINKTYLALVEGYPDKTGTIEFPIGRDHATRTRMKAYKTPPPAGMNGIRPATTHYKVLNYLDNASLVEVKPITGRTHQIRVHFSAIGHPIIGDVVYGHQSPLIDRQALHAYQLEFTFDGKPYLYRFELPQDFKNALKKLEKSNQ